MSCGEALAMLSEPYSATSFFARSRGTQAISPSHRKSTSELDRLRSTSWPTTSSFRQVGWYPVRRGASGILSERFTNFRVSLSMKESSRSAYGVMIASCWKYVVILALYADHAPPTVTTTSVPRRGTSTTSSSRTRGSFFWMSMSSTTRAPLARSRAALDVTTTGSPELFFAQTSAIFAPNPNFPRVCRTPYLLPDSTRPIISGIASRAMPHPLSRHVTR
mmetsp:Transcript_22654/g.70932  ORF Transcript_22654/g.70932 Transcript_22654/m.70932 type:complete len:220 (-) Transcript_22654:335-994(-)